LSFKKGEVIDISRKENTGIIVFCLSANSQDGGLLNGMVWKDGFQKIISRRKCQRPGPLLLQHLPQLRLFDLRRLL
jgi:hypothetical protein